MSSKPVMLPVKQGEDVSTYRYKMPAVVRLNQAAGAGIKTNVGNMAEIAHAISRTLKSLRQWFSYSLGSQVQIEQNTGHLLINGQHEVRKLQSAVYEFIDAFVLCPRCTNPETTFEKNGNQLFLHCNACGQTSPVNVQGLNVQRMATWLLTNLSYEQGGPQNVTQRTKGRLDEIDRFQRDEATRKQSSSRVVDLKVDELEAILKELEGDQKKDAPTMSREELEPFCVDFANRLKNGESDSVLCDAFANMVKMSGINLGTQMTLLVRSLFASNFKDVIDIINNRRNLILSLTLIDGADREFLNAFTSLLLTVGMGEIDVIRSSCAIYQTLYDNEVVDENILKSWRAHPSRRYEKNQAQSKELRDSLIPFFEWLDTAQMEDEEIPETPAAQEDDAGEEKFEINKDDL